MTLHLHKLDNFWSFKTLTKTLLAGLIATACMDLWALIVEYLFHIPVTWRAISRIIAHIANGSATWDNLTQLPPLPNENLYGWLFHYLVGMAYAFLYIFTCKTILKSAMTWYSALLFAWSMMLFPLVFLSILMGKGLFYDHSIHQWHGLAYTFSCHTAFGLGLIISLVMLHKPREKKHDTKA